MFLGIFNGRTRFRVAVVGLVMVLGLAALVRQGMSNDGLLGTASEPPIQPGQALSALAASNDIFVQFVPNAATFPAITGNAADSGYKGWIQVSSLQWGSENTPNISSASGGAGAGKMQFKELTIKKQADTATPDTIKAEALGANYTANIAFRKAGAGAGKNDKAYMMWTLGTTLIASDQLKSEGEGVEEQITLQFGALKIDVAPQKQDGSLGTAVSSCWSIMTNKAECPATTK
ncbi:MAG: type VI secretion system tube protein Hcp [Chloroflexi bacterium]|nr:type VI secretion system tube protein Hcp [Chloroflexota bacterium]